MGGGIGGILGGFAWWVWVFDLICEGLKGERRDVAATR